jgi:hypothetical protein
MKILYRLLSLMTEPILSLELEVRAQVARAISMCDYVLYVCSVKRLLTPDQMHVRILLFSVATDYGAISFVCIAQIPHGYAFSQFGVFYDRIIPDHDFALTICEQNADGIPPLRGAISVDEIESAIKRDLPYAIDKKMYSRERKCERSRMRGIVHINSRAHYAHCDAFDRMV